MAFYQLEDKPHPKSTPPSNPWEAVVRKNFTKLVNVMDPTLFLDEIFSKRLITRAQYQTISAFRTPAAKSRYLLFDCLIIKPEQDFWSFLEVLKETDGCKHLVDLMSRVGLVSAPPPLPPLQGSRAVEPLGSSDLWEVHVRPKFSDIVKQLRPCRIIDSLYQEEVISYPEYQEINALPIQQEQARFLLMNCLFSKSADCFHTFIKIIKKTEECKLIEQLMIGDQQLSTASQALETVKGSSARWIGIFIDRSYKETLSSYIQHMKTVADDDLGAAIRFYYIGETPPDSDRLLESNDHAVALLGPKKVDMLLRGITESKLKEDGAVLLEIFSTYCDVDPKNIRIKESKPTNSVAVILEMPVKAVLSLMSLFGNSRKQFQLAEKLREAFPDLTSVLFYLGSAPSLKLPVERMPRDQTTESIIQKEDLFELNTGLMDAIETCSNIIEALLDAGASPDAKKLAVLSNEGSESIVAPYSLLTCTSSALHFCCYFENEIATKLLLGKGAKVDVRNSRGETPLMVAAMKENPSSAQALIKAGANVHCAVEGSDFFYLRFMSSLPMKYLTAFDVSCLSGKLSAARLLLPYFKEALRKQENHLVTLLGLCYLAGNSEIVELLSEGGLQTSTQEALMSLCLVFKDNWVAIIHMIIRLSNAKINSNMNLKDTRILEAILQNEFKSKSSEVVMGLVSVGADLEVFDDRGRTLYLFCCQYGSLRSVELLLAAGCRATVHDKMGKGSFDMAFDGSNLEVVQWLLDQKENVNKQDNNGRTPLFRAVEKSDSRFVSALIAAGADLEVVDCDGMTAFLYCCWKGSVANLEVLVNAGCQTTVTDKNGWGSLHVASDGNNLEVTQWLIDRKENVNKQDNFDKTPLNLAVEKGHFPVALTLVSAGADLLALDKILQNCFHKIAMWWWKESSADMARLSIATTSSTSVFLEDKFLKTPIDRAFGKIRKLYNDFKANTSFSRLHSIECSSSPQMIVCVAGSLQAGKSSLVNSLTRLSQEKKAIKFSGEAVYHGLQLGVGVSIISSSNNTLFYEIGDCNKGGHRIFSTNYVGVDVVLVVLDMTEEKTDGTLMKTAVDGLLLIRNASYDMSERKPAVILVGNVKSKDDSQMMSVESKLKNLAAKLSRHYQSYFKVLPRVFALQCINPKLQEMNELSSLLSSHKKSIGQEVLRKIPPVVDGLLSKLLADIHKEDGFLFSPSILEGLFCSNMKNVDSEAASLISKYLKRMGQIVMADGHHVMSPHYLYQLLIAPFTLVQLRGGKARTKEIEAILSAFHQTRQTRDAFLALETGEVMEILRSLDICHQIKGYPDVFRFPSLVEEMKEDDGWNPDNSMLVYCGRRFQGHNETVDVINPNTMPTFQNIISASVDGDADLWKGGISLSKRYDGLRVEGMVESRKNGKFIDIITRGPEDSEGECLKLSEELQKILMSVLDEKSPGTTIDRLFISLKDLKRHSIPFAYSEMSLGEAIEKQGQVSCHVETSREGRLIRESVRDLLYVSDDHIIRVSCNTRQIICLLLEEDNSWLKVAQHLGFSTEEQISMRGSNSAMKMLRSWSKSLKANVSTFYIALVASGRSDVISQCN
eukprot:m.63071 g.63071  ORF g.63071 m.63071 type:complete len:1577 (+) comp35139_c0_seq1:79-4809(+)